MKFHDESNNVQYLHWFEGRSLVLKSLWRAVRVRFRSPTAIRFVRPTKGSRNERCSFDEMNWFVPDVIPRVRVRVDVVVVSSSKRGDHSRFIREMNEKV